MGFSVTLWGAEKLVPAEYWCPYGTCILFAHESKKLQTIHECLIMNLHVLIALGVLLTDHIYEFSLDFDWKTNFSIEIADLSPEAYNI